MLENEVGARYQPHHNATFVDFGSDRRSDRTWYNDNMAITFFILRFALSIKILHIAYKISCRNPVSEFLQLKNSRSTGRAGHKRRSARHLIWHTCCNNFFNIRCVLERSRRDTSIKATFEDQKKWERTQKWSWRWKNVEKHGQIQKWKMTARAHIYMHKLGIQGPLMGSYKHYSGRISKGFDWSWLTTFFREATFLLFSKL